MYGSAMFQMPAGWPLNLNNPLLRGALCVATFNEGAGRPCNWLDCSGSTLPGIGTTFSRGGTQYGPGVKLGARTVIGFQGSPTPGFPLTMVYLGAFDRTQLGSEDGRILSTTDLEPGGLTLVYNVSQVGGWGTLKNNVAWVSMTGSTPTPTVGGMVAAALVLNADNSTRIFVYDYATGTYGTSTNSNTSALVTSGTGRWGINQERQSGFASTFTPTYNLAIFSKTTWTAQDFQSFVSNPSQIWLPSWTRGARGVSISSYTLTADAGAYSLAGQAATPTAARLLTADAGAYSLAGQAASFIASRVLAAASGAYSLIGRAATLATSGTWAGRVPDPNRTTWSRAGSIPNPRRTTWTRA